VPLQRRGRRAPRAELVLAGNVMAIANSDNGGTPGPRCAWCTLHRDTALVYLSECSQRAMMLADPNRKLSWGTRRDKAEGSRPGGTGGVRDGRQGVPAGRRLVPAARAARGGAAPAPRRAGPGQAAGQRGTRRGCTQPAWTPGWLPPRARRRQTRALRMWRGSGCRCCAEAPEHPPQHSSPARSPACGSRPASGEAGSTRPALMPPARAAPLQRRARQGAGGARRAARGDRHQRKAPAGQRGRRDMRHQRPALQPGHIRLLARHDPEARRAGVLRAPGGQARGGERVQGGGRRRRGLGCRQRGRAAGARLARSPAPRSAGLQRAHVLANPLGNRGSNT